MFTVEPAQNMFDIVTSTFPEKELLDPSKNLRLSCLIVNQDAERVDK